MKREKVSLFNVTNSGGLADDVLRTDLWPGFDSDAVLRWGG